MCGNASTSKTPAFENRRLGHPPVYNRSDPGPPTRDGGFVGVRTSRIICLQIVLGLLGCGKESRTSNPVVPIDLAPGRITLEVSSNSHSWQYQVTPFTGTVVELGLNSPESVGSKQAIQVSTTGKANCFFEGSEAKSPDDGYIAQCSGGYPGKPAEFGIRKSNTKSATFQLDKSGRQILGFVWSPNSHSVALLTSSQKRGYGPLELLWAFAGHPVPRVTVYLDFIGADGAYYSEYLIKSDILYGKARILNWSR